MITIAVIAFREFLEVFLIVGVFIGISKKTNLKREKEIISAAIIGIFGSLIITCLTFFFSDFVKDNFTKQRTEILESYLKIFSGFFIAYVILSLHDLLRKDQAGKLRYANRKLQENIFDFSIFLTIVLLILREGIEIAIFTASTSLFIEFMQNITGLLIGFAAASIFGILIYFFSLKLSIKKVYKFTQYLLILLGATLVQSGITELLFSSIAGIDQELRIIRLLIMIIYLGIIYFVFLKQNRSHQTTP